MKQCEYGMVVTSHAVASAAGLEVLKEGGNATSEDSYRDLGLSAINETGGETRVQTKPVGR